jgi:hypothetical protein
MPQPRFLYFDLGNVLLKFDHHRAARQMGEVAGVPEQQVWDLVFAGDLELRYEAGEVDDRQFFEIFCRETGTRPDYDALHLAGSEIFTRGPATGWEFSRIPVPRTGPTAGGNTAWLPRALKSTP